MERGSLAVLLALLLARSTSLVQADATDVLNDVLEREVAAAQTTTTLRISNTTTSTVRIISDQADFLDNATLPAPLVASESALAPPCQDCIDKVVLVMLEMVGLGFFGIDRFYAGSITTGILKLISLSGCGVWFVVDWFVVIVNAIEKKDSIHICGFNAQFETTGINTSRTLAIIAVTLASSGSFLCCCSLCIYGVHHCVTGRQPRDRNPATLSRRELSAPDDYAVEEDLLQADADTSFDHVATMSFK